MKCPECSKEIDHVWVYSQCFQRGTLDGNKVTEYDDLEVMDTQAIECPECNHEITASIEE